MASPPPGVDPRLLRPMGWMFVVVGVLLAGGIAVIAVNMAPTMLHPGVEVSGSRWTGDRAMTVQTFLVFAGVLLFGLGAIANGLWIARHGAFHPTLRAVLLALGALLFAGVLLFTAAHHPA